jgi:hypothetical protein
MTLCGIVAHPTPVVSGHSPVTPGDMAYAVPLVLRLPSKWTHLALGSTREPHACGVCNALRERPDRYSDDEREAANALLAWHGSDALRCGVIYGIAAGLVAARKDRP